MPQFTYQAVDGSGKELTGTLEAPDRPAAQRQLTSRGLQPYKVAESSAGKDKPVAAKTAKRMLDEPPLIVRTPVQSGSTV